jgi:predicted amidohydrolase
VTNGIEITRRNQLRKKGEQHMSSHLTQKTGMTRRQALATAGRAVAGAMGLAALPSLSGRTATAEQIVTGLPQQDPPPSLEKSAAQTLRIATCQFPVTADVTANGLHIQNFMHQAAEQGAHLLHTSEGSLSGYGGFDIPTFANYDWNTLRKEIVALRTLASELKIYLALGSAHFLDEKTKPTNCVYLISPDGSLLDRYDKSFLTQRDQEYYSAGDRRVTRDIRGVRIGLAICYDVCWPQLYMSYRELGATVILHSMYNAKDPGPSRLDVLNTHEVPTRCSDNRMWAVVNNSSQPYSHWGSFIARPDATIAKQLAMNEPGMLIHDFPDEPPKGEWYFNLRPMRLRDDEILSWGKVSHHPRQRNGQSEP